MMPKIKKIFLSRKTILVLFVLILLVVIIGELLPQRFTTSRFEIEEWRRGNPVLAWPHETLGLDHVYTTPWFAVILTLFLTSLGLSVMEQFRIARKLTFQNVGARRAVPLQGGQMPDSSRRNLPLRPERVKRVCRSMGYLMISAADEGFRFVKHPWGYWGSFMLHLGIFLVVGASLFITLTEARGRIHMTEGEIFNPGDEWFVEEKGLLAKSLVLPEAVQLDEVKPEFYEDYRLRELTSKMSFTASDGSSRQKTVAVSRMLKERGVTIYQIQRFGHAFLLKFRDEEETDRGMQLQIKSPPNPEEASYGEFNIDWMPIFHTFKAKYYWDFTEDEGDREGIRLVLRIERSGEVVGQLPLQTGESGQLGPYSVTLVGVVNWAAIVFVKSHGMAMLFLGFAVIIFGAALNYFTPPRELMAVKCDDGYSLDWKSARFAEFYVDEKDRIMFSLTEGAPCPYTSRPKVDL